MNLHFAQEYTGCYCEASCLNQKTRPHRNFSCTTYFVYKIRTLELGNLRDIPSVFSSRPKLVILKVHKPFMKMHFITLEPQLNSSCSQIE